MKTRTAHSLDTRHEWSIANPSGLGYQKLLRAACDFSDTVIFVTGFEIEPHPDVVALLRRLERFQKRPKRRTRSWPGTIRGPEVWCHEYAMMPSVSKILCDAADSWFDWIPPHRPEDLSLMHKGREVLVGISHEQELVLTTTRSGLARILEQVPELHIQSGPGYRGS